MFDKEGVTFCMNYRIEAIDVLLNRDCILEKYCSLIPYKTALINNLCGINCFTKDKCVALPNDILVGIGLPDSDMADLFKRFLVMYDVKPQKLNEINKICSDKEEINSFMELYLLPGVKAIRARLYYEAGYKHLRDIASALPEQIINKTAGVIKQKQLTLTVPLLKEVKTHIAVAKAYSFYGAE